MATLDLDPSQATYQIQSYQPGSLKINHQLYTASIIITPDQLIIDWPPQTIEALSNQSFDLLFDSTLIRMKPDILLIGTGERLIFPPIDTYGHLLNQRIGVEIMDTRAACRTFNALTAEGRNVAAALIIK